MGKLSESLFQQPGENSLQQFSLALFEALQSPLYDRRADYFVI